MLQPAKEGLSRQDSRPRRGELDRQRQAVKPSTDLDNGGRVVGAQLKERVDGGGSFNKQAHRVCPLQPLERCRVGGTWKSKWREVKCHFASAPKKATAGSDDPKLWAALEQVLDDGDGIRQLFQIVKEEKRLACGEVIDERVEDRPGAHLADPDRPSDRRRQDRRVRYRCEAYEGRLSTALVREPVGELEGETRLSASARPGKRNQVVRRDRRRKLVELMFATNKCRQRDRQERRSPRAEPRDRFRRSRLHVGPKPPPMSKV